MAVNWVPCRYLLSGPHVAEVGRDVESLGMGVGLKGHCQLQSGF